MPFTNEELLQIRRELHEIPELGMAEFETQAYLLDKIRQMTQAVKHVKIRTWKTAVLVKITGFDSDKIIGWRENMDRLPVNKETNLECSKKYQGRMHACRHDIHMAVALGLLKIAIETPSKNDRLFLFQPAEENLSGAKLLY
uniref:M20/M25/M40 family metallo-hydrolase n=1 Tax=Lactococcus formosensis TaxID=1281486 RepID=UPI0032B40A8C